MLHTKDKTFSKRDFRNAMGAFATGVVVITSEHEESVHGMTANAFISVSLEPPLVLVSIDKKARMHDVLGGEDCFFGISILAADQQGISDHFAGRMVTQSAPEFMHLSGVPVIKNALVALATKRCHVYEGGDHTLFVAEVLDLQQVERLETEAPLLFQCGKYQRLAETCLAD